MHILFAGGGTAGHINPALAVAGYIKSVSEDVKISYIGKEGGLESILVPEAGIDFYSIRVDGFQRSISLSNIKKNIIAVKRVISASSTAKRLLKELSPDIVMGTGGYVSGPVLREAHKLGIPTVIHEQNAFPGVTTKMLSQSADRVMLAMPEAKKYLKLKNDPVITGNPVREAVIHADREQSRSKLGVDGKTVILSFGGSLGARPLNEAVCSIIANSYKNKNLHFIHSTGKSGYEGCIEALEKNGVDLNSENLDVRQYISDMDVCMAAADIVICRAGAITLSELTVCAKPAVLIPSPYVAENHQYHNAMTLVNANAAEIIEEKDLTGESLTKKINKMLADKNTLSTMSFNAKKCAISDANVRIYNVIKEFLSDK